MNRMKKKKRTRGHEGLVTGSLDPERVPDVDVEVVVAGHQEAAGLGEGHRRHAADDVVVRVLRQLLVGANVVQLDRGVVRARAEGRPLRKELRQHEDDDDSPKEKVMGGEEEDGEDREEGEREKRVSMAWKRRNHLRARRECYPTRCS